MIDTHTHLYFTETYPDGGDAAVVRALEAGVSHMVLPSVSLGSTDTLLGLHSRWPDVTSVAVGLHPTELKADWRDELREIRYRFGDTPTVAWGEIGLDFHYGREEATRQMDAFGYQLDEAYSEGKPVIIHSRDALEETLHVTGLIVCAHRDCSSIASRAEPAKCAASSRHTRKHCSASTGWPLSRMPPE